MPDSVMARTGPHEVEVEAGQKYFWCACGRTKTPPYCDGNHSGTGVIPVMWVAERNEVVYFCGCHRSGMLPFCDGTHNNA